MNWFHHEHQPSVPAERQREIIDAKAMLAHNLLNEELDVLIDLTGQFIDHKRWEGLDDLEVTTEMKVTVAANACIPILNLGLPAYDRVEAILLYRGTQQSEDNRIGPVSNVVADGPIPTIGQAAPQSGPVALSWDATEYDSMHPGSGSNVVIHEFAHKIDMLNGYADGLPPLNDRALNAWDHLIDDELSAPGDEASDEVLRPYAFTNRAEFFAVAVETFFTCPQALAEAKPELYQRLADFFQLDPKVW